MYTGVDITLARQHTFDTYVVRVMRHSEKEFDKPRNNDIHNHNNSNNDSNNNSNSYLSPRSHTTHHHDTPLHTLHLNNTSHHSYTPTHTARQHNNLLDNSHLSPQHLSVRLHTSADVTPPLQQRAPAAAQRSAPPEQRAVTHCNALQHTTASAQPPHSSERAASPAPMSYSTPHTAMPTHHALVQKTLGLGSSTAKDSLTCANWSPVWNNLEVEQKNSGASSRAILEGHSDMITCCDWSCADGGAR